MARYNVNGRTVVITGSTGGLGTAIATALRAKGANLVLLDLDEEATAAQAETLGGPTVALGSKVDVTNMATLEAAMARAANHFGRIDIVVANAGVDPVSPMVHQDATSFEHAIDINLVGVWRTFKAALPYVQQQEGYLLATSSMAAFIHSPLQAAYTASKAGTWALADSIRLELRHLGVGVGTLHPTFFHTPLLGAVHADPAGFELWGGNTKGLWKTVPIDQVVTGTLRGIERRADTIIVPKSLTLTARTPGLFRKPLEKLGFKPSSVIRAIALSDDSTAARTSH